MRESVRLAATLIIWGAFVASITVLLTSSTGPLASSNSAALFGIVAILAGMAMFSTLVVWRSGGQGGGDVATRAAKGKRAGRNRVARLIESLDDDEVYELEALLLGRDDESARQNRAG